MEKKIQGEGKGPRERGKAKIVPPPALKSPSQEEGGLSRYLPQAEGGSLPPEADRKSKKKPIEG